ncbi:Putative tannase/feruloyl esterase, alpha/Beta hydrolase [Septoria linicola]|uniref:Carboxylic ester hydrolase n=1 Tax=Septoria linicola TaxID=215465 RepID=A0A9Q9ECT3_9PEZI|nr:putative tannase/feruloyl esterase, alpha/Beta hydrolase [Septoria linicola]USW47041.1 Putative tannase/feruloyl esterase, alpha/Beta hydrolase [Septoria linicola]
MPRTSYQACGFSCQAAGLLLSFLLLLSPTVFAFQCTPEAFQQIVPSTATVEFARQLQDNATFEVPEGNVAYPISPTQLRALCVVQVNVTSSPSSMYSFGLFLPENWNGRFLAVGNGGFSGGINWLDAAAGVGYGFASMSTDTGHSSVSSDLSWALNEPEKQIDFGYRAMHGSVVLAKEIVAAYHGTNSSYSYYSGCSTGGRQGLKDIELYPEDFNGVLAGAPAWWTAHLQTWTVRLALYNLPTTAEHHIPPALFPTIASEVLRQCDPQDGLIDTIISDPRACHFVPETLLCSPRSTNTSECLTPAQLTTLDHIYHDYVDTNQTFVFPHLEIGSEGQWEVLLGSTQPSGLGTGYVQNLLLNDPDWSFYDFNYSIVAFADKLDPGNATADNFDLSPFHKAGGKLLHYHGLADGLIATGSSDYFYSQVIRTLRPQGIELDSWYRYFPVPGMQHCGGTAADVNSPWYFAGANQAADLNPSVNGVPGFRDADHDALLALMRWTENATAPDQIIATKWHNDTLQDKVLRQRPLCPYPQRAEYAGNGDPDAAENWQCRDKYSLNVQQP